MTVDRLCSRRVISTGKSLANANSLPKLVYAKASVAPKLLPSRYVDSIPERMDHSLQNDEEMVYSLLSAEGSFEGYGRAG